MRINMSKLKQQFSELRKTTPKYIQWLLLAAAFIVVLILLTLLITGSKNKAHQVQSKKDIPLQMVLFQSGDNDNNVKPHEWTKEWTNDILDWSNVVVGTTKTETINVRTNAPAKVKVSANKKVAGFTLTTTCTDAAVIHDKVSCNIYLKYAPTIAMKNDTVVLSVYWRAEKEPESMMNNTKRITVVLSAINPEIIPEPKPIAEPEPQYNFIDDDYLEPEPTIREEIDTIAPPVPLQIEPELPKSEPVKNVRPIESCSDFAFPGYDASGNQIGWIKPERGGYYFHPFSEDTSR